MTLHLNDNGKGGDIVVLEGEARIDSTAPSLPDHAAYRAKYEQWIVDFTGTAEEMATIYNVPIRIRPTRGRAFGG